LSSFGIDGSAVEFHKVNEGVEQRIDRAIGNEVAAVGANVAKQSFEGKCVPKLELGNESLMVIRE